MSKLPSSKLIINALLKNGLGLFLREEVIVNIEKETRQLLYLHHEKEIPIGTFRSIVRQSGLTVDDFK